MNSTPCPHQSARPAGRPGYDCAILDLAVAPFVCDRCQGHWPAGRPPANPEAARQAAGLPPLPDARPRLRLGDAVHFVAHPFSRLLGLEFCAACSRRRRRLNRYSIPLPRALAARRATAAPPPRRPCPRKTTNG